MPCFFKNKKCEIVDPIGVKLLSIKMQKKCFSLEWKHTKIKAYTTIKDKTSLWHKKFGHANYASLF